MTPVETLRAAASLLRERGKKATPGPWSRLKPPRGHAAVMAPKPDDEDGRYRDGRPELVNIANAPTWSDRSFFRPRAGRDLDWITTVHPGLAEPLAAWLDSAAVDAEQIGMDFRALAVARVLLGEEAEGKP